MSVKVLERPKWSSDQIAAARRVVDAAFDLDRRSHSWSEWYRQTYHHIRACDEATWDALDEALTAFVKATEIADLADVHWSRP